VFPRTVFVGELWKQLYLMCKSIPVVIETFPDNRDGTSDFMGEVQITLQQTMDSGTEEKI